MSKIKQNHHNCMIFSCFYWSTILIWLAHMRTLSCEEVSRSRPIITLEQGPLQGVLQKTESGKEWVAYRGIPYATQERFKRAGPPPSWNGTRDASIFGSACMQMSFTTPGDVEGSENCLFINVATPLASGPGRSDIILKPEYSTIVYIHGGGFQGGSGGQSGADYWMDNGNVVFITFNYRLGPLGFLNIGDNGGVVEANIGLKDQTDAMIWVQKNIEAFGGMKENITLFGGSAGAASVHYHLLSPMSKGLFQRAISGSGSALCPWGFDPNPGRSARVLAQQLGCPDDVNGGIDKMAKCLLGKPAKDFFGKSSALPNWKLDSTAPFIPSVERSPSPKENFLTDDPAILLATGNFNRIPWLTGVTNQEGHALHSAMILNDPTLVEELNSNWDVVAPVTLTLDDVVPKDEIPRVVRQIYKFYFGEDKISPSNMVTKKKLQQLYSDRNFFTGVRASILHHAKYAPVFSYIFDYVDPNVKSWLTTILGLNISGVSHGDDFAYYFKFYMNPTDENSAMGLPLNSTAKEMSKKIVALLAAFAKDGIPNAGVWGDEWSTSGTDSTTMEWYHLDKHSTTKMESEEFRTRMNFWNDILSFEPSIVANSFHPEL